MARAEQACIAAVALAPPFGLVPVWAGNGN